MITVSPIIKERMKPLWLYGDVVYIYQLLIDDTRYIGSTKNPVARYMGHLNLNTRDTADHIAEAMVVEMIILDVTTPTDREVIEAKWIHEISGVVNTNRLESYYQKYQEDPRAYQSLHDGTFVLESPGVKDEPEGIEAETRSEEVCDLEYEGVKLTIKSRDMETAKAHVLRELASAKRSNSLFRYAGSTLYR